METERVPKKKSFIIRDVYKLYRSISKIWPRDKPKVASSPSSSSSSLESNTMTKPERKFKSKSKSKSKRKFKAKAMTEDDLPKRVPVKDPPRWVPQEAGHKAGEGGANPCRVRSYRYDGFNFLWDKPSLSRSSSQRTPTQKPSLSTLKRSWTTIKVDPCGFTNSIANTPIFYSSSSKVIARAPPTEQLLECTLEELCNGCTKKIKIKRDVTITGETSQEEEIVKIKVKPGWRGGTKVTFEGKGIEGIGSSPADLTFVVVEKEHELFRRDGDDLKMTVEIPLVEALTGCNLSVPLPDGNTMDLKIDDVIEPEYVKVIQGKGMPNPKEKGKRGDLRIIFQTKYPKKLTEDQRAEIRSILEDST